MIQNRNFIALLFLAFIVGCAQLGLEQPKSIGDRIAYGKAELTAVYQAIPPAIESGHLSKANAKELLVKADGVKDALDAADIALANGKPTDAMSYLQTANTFLTVIQKALPKK